MEWKPLPYLGGFYHGYDRSFMPPFPVTTKHQLFEPKPGTLSDTDQAGATPRSIELHGTSIKARGVLQPWLNKGLGENDILKNR